MSFSSREKPFSFSIYSALGTGFSKASYALFTSIDCWSAYSCSLCKNILHLPMVSKSYGQQANKSKLWYNNSIDHYDNLKLFTAAAWWKPKIWYCNSGQVGLHNSFKMGTLAHPNTGVQLQSCRMHIDEGLYLEDGLVGHECVIIHPMGGGGTWPKSTIRLSHHMRFVPRFHCLCQMILPSLSTCKNPLKLPRKV
mgnify:CR=1 FL=1